MFSFKKSNKTLRAVALISFLMVSVLLLSKCEEETARPREYPRVKTSPVSNISEKGATFNGDIYSLGSEPITDHGFVWGVTDNPTVNYNKILLGPSETTGVYSADILTSLKKDSKYTVKSFVQTHEHVVYGVPVTFISLGSGSPVIFGFEPDSVRWLDTLTVKGKNFSYAESENIVKLNQLQCLTIGSTDTTLFVLVNGELSELSSILSVELAGNKVVYTKDSLHLITPVIKDYYPKQARWGDTLTFIGKDFQTGNRDNTLTAKISGFSAKLIERGKDSLLIIVPMELSTITNSIKLKINNLSFSVTENMTLLPPVISSIYPKEGTWNNVISLTGLFNNLAFRNTVFFDNIQATILSCSGSLLKIVVPQNLSMVKSRIIYKATPFTVISSDTFSLKPPVIYSFSPSSGPSNSNVTIKGKYFSKGNTTVKFGITYGEILSSNDSILVVAVPSDLNGAFKIAVSVKLQTTTSIDNFLITNPKINSTYPLSGTFNDEITIIGENFISSTGNTIVNFGQIRAAIKSLTATKIVVLVPESIDSIPTVLYVKAGLNYSNRSDLFTLSPPEITSVSPTVLIPGQDVVITGSKFNPVSEFNQVFYDIYPLTIKSSTGSEIIATVSSALPRGVSKIKVRVGGYIRSSSQDYSVSSQWLRIQSPEILTSFNNGYYRGISNYGKSIKDYGYIASVAAFATFRFDPSDKSWSKLSIPAPFNNAIVKMGEVVCRDTFYLISGSYDAIGMKAFDQSNNNWRTFDLPFGTPANTSGVAFTLNDKIYFGLHYFNISNWFWECDPANNYSWTRKGDFPGTPPTPFTTYFTLGNKGYVVFSNNNVWQFDPDLLAWTRKSDFPGPARELAVSFILGGYAYMGTGTGGGNLEFNDIWKYDPVADLWTFVTYMPQKRHSAVAFAIKDKAYIGYGLHFNSGYQQDLFDFYEFDPNYPLK